MFPELPPDFEWLEPWQRLEDSGDALVTELQKELALQHVLHGVPVVAVGRRSDSDDVLFATADPLKPIAVVHLTWIGRTEVDPQWPWTTLYDSWPDWIERCLRVDHQENSADG